MLSQQFASKNSDDGVNVCVTFVLSASHLCDNMCSHNICVYMFGYIYVHIVRRCLKVVIHITRVGIATYIVGKYIPEK